MRGSALLLAVAVLATGCGFTDLHLDLAYADAAARRGPIGELDPIPFDLAEVEDKRLDVARVGYQKNGYEMNVSSVRAATPVADLFHDAIAGELRANGHGVDPSARLRIEAAVTMFWVDLQPGLTMTAVATASCALRVIDRDADTAIYEQQYTGHYTHRNSSAFKSAYERPLLAALERMAWEFALDPELIAILRAARSRPAIGVE